MLLWSRTVGIEQTLVPGQEVDSGQVVCLAVLEQFLQPRPEATEEAAPPPRPMSIDGPPRTTSFDPAGSGAFSTMERRMFPQPPAIMMGL